MQAGEASAASTLSFDIAATHRPDRQHYRQMGVSKPVRLIPEPPNHCKGKDLCEHRQLACVEPPRGLLTLQKRPQQQQRYHA